MGEMSQYFNSGDETIFLPQTIHFVSVWTFFRPGSKGVPALHSCERIIKTPIDWDDWDSEL